MSLSNQGGQRPLRATLRQAQGDRPTHLAPQHVMGSKYEVSIREPFYRSRTADRSFVPQDDRKIEHVMGSGKIWRNPEGRMTIFF